MITEKAWKLAELARKEKHESISAAAFDELVDNCHPTEVEFAEFARGLILSSRVIWKLIINIPKWDFEHDHFGT